MEVGFTGTQHGMTRLQARTLMRLFTEISISRGHHGCCVGVDKQVHILLMWLLGPDGIILHPPEDLKKVAGEVFDYFPDENIREPKPYLDRNHDIVDETGRLVGIPREDKEVLRSGTWATIRYAQKQGKPITIILPDGDLVYEGRRPTRVFRLP